MLNRWKFSLTSLLSSVLKIGLGIAVIVIFSGGALFLWQQPNDKVDDHIFDKGPASLRALGSVFDAARGGSGLAIIQLGIIFMIATPIIRVITCLIMFAAQKDGLYVIFSAFVLGVLLWSFF